MGGGLFNELPHALIAEACSSSALLTTVKPEDVLFGYIEEQRQINASTDLAATLLSPSYLPLPSTHD